MSRWRNSSIAVFVLASVLATGAHALGQPSFVTHEARGDSVAIASGGRASSIYVDASDFPGVLRAARDLQADVERVASVKPDLVQGGEPTGREVVIVGTLGKSALIDRLARAGVIDVSAVRGRWEAYLVQAVAHPMPGVDRALVIAGADKRGTIFGIYEVSEQIGVSPWYWWADVPVEKHANVFIAAGTRVADAPVVKYRGIFINDEWPAMGEWSAAKFGGFNHKMYEHVFELILRLKGNYLWPAMWRSAFFADDPENGRLADEYGIVMGTSHHEPLMRAQAEWKHHSGGGAWNYETNGERLREFWKGGIDRARDWEKIVTLGMRGDGDKPMTDEANVALLERIVADQRKLIASELDRDVTRVPQTWMLYKEVQEYYERGMRVPDDVTLLWCDDNFANIRRLPTAEERKRAGGAGIYYHFDYYGSPRSYKWINDTPLPKVWEQMHLAWKYGADRIWIVNVGDLKPMEVPIEFFLTYAWNPSRWPATRLDEYLRLWATREFGPEHAADIADIVAKYAKYNGRRKPEALEPTTYSLVNYREAERMAAEFRDIARRASAIQATLPPGAKSDAFYELVMYPAAAAQVVTEMQASAGLNRIYATQGRASANELAQHVSELFVLDAALAQGYHERAGGKWDHMMSQTHLGYTAWYDPPRNIMPAVSMVQLPEAPEMGVAVEGSELPARGGMRFVLPALDAFEKRTRYVEVFNRGATPFRFTVAASEPWITLSMTQGEAGPDKRIEVGAKWGEVPSGVHEATVTIAGPDDRKVSVTVPVVNREVPKAAGFVETGGVVSVEAEHYSRAVAAGGYDWMRVPDLGRTLSAMTTLPVETQPVQGMHLEYAMHLFDAGKVTVHAIMAPTQKFQPGAGLRFALSFDDETPQVVNMHADESKEHWSRTVLDGVAEFTTTHAIVAPGAHVLKYWPLDAGVVLEKLVVDAGGMKPSYLGPPESPRVP
jgi:hypothetical protein